MHHDVDFRQQVQASAGAAPSATADAFKALGQSLSTYGFDNESAAFISTSLLQQQNAFTLKMTQQRQAFEACIESFKRSAAAQMELQLVQLSVIPLCIPSYLLAARVTLHCAFC